MDMESFSSIVPGNTPRGASVPAKSAPSSRNVSTRQTVHKMRENTKPVDEKLVNLTFKTANKDDIGKLESWVHNQLASIHNRTAVKSPEEKLACTFEQIKVLDVANDKIASMVGFHCNLKEEFIRRIWASSAELYNRVFNDLSMTVNDLKFKLMDKSLAVNRLEDALEQKNDRLKNADASSNKSGTTYEMILIRQLEAEMLLKNKEILAMQETVTNLAIWFPEFSHYGPSLMKRYLPPVMTAAPATENVDGLPRTDVLELAQHYLKKDLKRLEDIGIGFQVNFPDDIADDGPPPSVAASGSGSATNAKAVQQQQQQQQATAQRPKPRIAPEFLQKSTSFSAAGENEYNLSYRSPSATRGKFFDSASGEELPEGGEDIPSGITPALPLLAAPSPQLAVDMVMTDFYTAQTRMFASVNASSTAAAVDPAAAALAAAAQYEALKRRDDEQEDLMTNEQVLRYKRRFRRLMQDAEGLEAELAALEATHEREALMHKKEMAALQAEVAALAGQLAATSSQVTSMAEKLPPIMFPPLIRAPPVVEYRAASAEAAAKWLSSQVRGTSTILIEESITAGGSSSFVSSAPLPMQNIEALVLRCLSSFVSTSPDDIQTLFGVDRYTYDTFFHLLSGQNATLAAPAPAGSSALAHHLYLHLASATSSCGLAREQVGRLLQSVREAHRRQVRRERAAAAATAGDVGGASLSEVPSFEDLAEAAGQDPTAVCPSLLSVLFELFQCDASPVAAAAMAAAAGSVVDMSTTSGAELNPELTIEEVVQEVVYRPPPKVSRPPLRNVPPPITIAPRRPQLSDNVYQSLSHPSNRDLRDVILFDLLVACYRAMKVHFRPSPSYINSSSGVCGYSAFPVQLCPRILGRVFQPLTRAVLDVSREDKSFDAVRWWRCLPVHSFDRVKLEVEMTSLSRAGAVSQHQMATSVNCYDCVLLCWRAAQTLHSQLSLVSSNLFKFLLSLVPQGAASRSFHLLLTHMTQALHTRDNDLSVLMRGEDPVAARKKAAAALPVVNQELAAELMALDGNGALTSYAFANLLLRSLPANLVQNFHHLIPTPSAVTISSALTGETAEASTSEADQMKALTDNGRLLTAKLKSMVAPAQPAAVSAARMSKVVTPRMMAVNGFLAGSSPSSSSKTATPTESYFKQSILLNKMLYPTETPTPLTSARSSSTDTDPTAELGGGNGGSSDAAGSSVERLLLHAKLCFDDNFIRVMPPSLSEITFTVIALKYYIGVFSRLVDSKRSLKNRLNRSEGNISNDFVQTLLAGKRDLPPAAVPGVGHSSVVVDRSSSNGSGTCAVCELDLFVRVETHYALRLKERMFRHWANMGLFK